MLSTTIQGDASWWMMVIMFQQCSYFILSCMDEDSRTYVLKMLKFEPLLCTVLSVISWAVTKVLLVLSSHKDLGVKDIRCIKSFHTCRMAPAPVATGETLVFNINIVIAPIYYEIGNKCIPRKIVNHRVLLEGKELLMIRWWVGSSWFSGILLLISEKYHFNDV